MWSRNSGVRCWLTYSPSSSKSNRHVMTCFSPSVRELFNRWNQGGLLDSLEASHQKFLDRRRATVEFGAPEALTPSKRALANCQLLLQALLHRAERLLASSGTMLLENNIYGIALIVRGHYETTAVLGYFCSRLESLSTGNIRFEDFEWNVADALMGAKHDLFTEARPPLNILTCIEKADKYLDRHVFQAKKGVLQDSYNWLSDFAHPNFLSNCASFNLDQATNRVVFRHQGELQREDFQLPGYLDISCKLFIDLFDAFTQRMSDGCLYR